MRVPSQARALVLGTVVAGAALLALAGTQSVGAPLAALALLGAAVVLTELIQVSGDENSFDPLEAHAFSFSSGVHIAAVLILGPWAAALVAAFGVVVVDGLRGREPQRIAFNASVLSAAAVAGGGVFELLGGSPGGLALPGDLPAVLALALAYYAVNAVLVSLIIAMSELESRASAWSLSKGSLQRALPSAAGEVGLGVALALFVRTEPWAIVALVPLVLTVYRSHERLVALRRETARALETFANIVDERDPHTYRHSARVAERVQRLACELGLSASEVARLRWAGRLHDLGKIAVDASVLQKPGALDEDEWHAMRRHPRLSARLLRRFRFAAEEAWAVECHHERFDGTGYYGVRAEEIPLTAHFLIVADSFDAMTSDRPYRKGLSVEVALAEIERNAGSQFHPAVAKAFVAHERGQDPLAELAPEQRDELRRLARPRRRRVADVLHLRSDVVSALGIIGACSAVGLGLPVLGVAAAAVALGALAVNRLDHRRARRLSRNLREAAAEAPDRDRIFLALVSQLSLHCKLRWAGLLNWRERDSSGAVAAQWSAGTEGPSPTSLTSWLLREVESASELLVASGMELGRTDAHVALPLARDGVTAGYLVLAIAGHIPGHVLSALRDGGPALAPRLLSPTPSTDEPGRMLRAVAV